MKKLTLTIALTFIGIMGNAQISKSINAFALPDTNHYWKHEIYNFGDDKFILMPKRDTIFCIILQRVKGQRLNPVSWSAEQQSQIDMVWNRGWACRERETIQFYFYIDRKTKVTRKIYQTILNP